LKKCFGCAKPTSTDLRIRDVQHETAHVWTTSRFIYASEAFGLARLWGHGRPSQLQLNLENVEMRPFHLFAAALVASSLVTAASAQNMGSGQMTNGQMSGGMANSRMSNGMSQNGMMKQQKMTKKKTGMMKKQMNNGM
jgi:hypothetical protein